MRICGGHYTNSGSSSHTQGGTLVLVGALVTGQSLVSNGHGQLAAKDEIASMICSIKET